jgi:polyisoprenoid-binding protein YceI
LKKNTVIIAALCLFTFQTIHAQKALKLQKYVVEYTVKNAGINSKGRFDNLTAEVVFDENMLDKSSISATIQTNSFNSGITMRDNHLKDKDYFDVKNYPTITLLSTKIVKSANGYLGTFNLTLKSTTKSVQLPFSIVKKDNTLEFKATDLSIDRTAYGIGKSSFTLSNTVRIAINATFMN